MTSTGSKRTNRKKPPASAKVAHSTSGGAVVAKLTTEIDKPAPGTKQELVLTLLSRRDGASIDEVMQATNWQQHSVRGFFAGTVKKKLGFNLASSKTPGEARRYKIAVVNGR